MTCSRSHGQQMTGLQAPAFSRPPQQAGLRELCRSAPLRFFGPNSIWTPLGGQDHQQRQNFLPFPASFVANNLSYILVSLHGTHKSLFMRQWASCCPWGCVCYNGALVTFLKGRFSRSALKYLQMKCYGVLDLFQNNLSLGVGEACAGV